MKITDTARLFRSYIKMAIETKKMQKKFSHRMTEEEAIERIRDLKETANATGNTEAVTLVNTMIKFVNEQIEKSYGPCLKMIDDEKRVIQKAMEDAEKRGDDQVVIGALATEYEKLCSERYELEQKIEAARI